MWEGGRKVAPFELVISSPPHMSIKKVVSSWVSGSLTNTASRHLSRRSLPRRGPASHPGQSSGGNIVRVAMGLHSRPLGQGDQCSQADFRQRVAWPSSSEPEPPGEGHRRVLCTASSLFHRVARLPNITCGKGSVASA